MFLGAATIPRIKIGTREIFEMLASQHGSGDLLALGNFSWVR
jgi:hypothetical protein